MGVIHEWKLDGGQLGLIHSREMHRHETSVTDLLPVEDGLWSGKRHSTPYEEDRADERQSRWTSPLSSTLSNLRGYRPYPMNHLSTLCFSCQK